MTDVDVLLDLLESNFQVARQRNLVRLWVRAFELAKDENWITSADGAVSFYETHGFFCDTSCTTPFDEFIALALDADLITRELFEVDRSPRDQNALDPWYVCIYTPRPEYVRAIARILEYAGVSDAHYGLQPTSPPDVLEEHRQLRGALLKELNVSELVLCAEDHRVFEWWQYPRQTVIEWKGLRGILDHGSPKKMWIAAWHSDTEIADIGPLRRLVELGEQFVQFEKDANELISVKGWVAP